MLAGERNLLATEGVASSMDRMRRLFDLFEQKTSLLHLLDLSQRAEGVQIYIGGESGLAPLDEMSVVTARYEVDGKVIGTLGRDRADAHGLRARDPDRRPDGEAPVERADAAARRQLKGDRRDGRRRRTAS